MRDLHKVREQTHVKLTWPQLFAVVGVALVLCVVTFLVGYSQGKSAAQVEAVVVELTPRPLITSEVEGESVGQLLARAAEKQAAEEGKLGLEYHAQLPAASAHSTPDPSAPTQPPPEPSPTPVAIRIEPMPAQPAAPRPAAEVAPALPPGQEGGIGITTEDGPAPQARVPAPGEGTASASRQWTVQVASYQTAEQATAMQTDLKGKGFDAYVVQAEVNGRTWHRVRVGSFAARTEAEAESDRIKAARSELSPMITYK